MNAAHVPYGESCLTRLLADSMGHERSRAILIATCRCATPSSCASTVILPRHVFCVMTTHRVKAGAKHDKKQVQNHVMACWVV